MGMTAETLERFSAQTESKCCDSCHTHLPILCSNGYSTVLVRGSHLVDFHLLLDVSELNQNRFNIAAMFPE